MMSQSAPYLEDEVQRPQALSANQMLNTRPKLEFKDLPFLALHTNRVRPFRFREPLADYRQFFKSKVGTSVP